MSTFIREGVMLWKEATIESGLKLTDQAMKFIEKIANILIRQVVSIDESQFGFVPGGCTTDEIFVVCQLQEKAALYCFSGSGECV